jgi:transposase
MQLLAVVYRRVRVQPLANDSVDATRQSPADVVQSSLQAELVSLKLQIQSLHETLGNLTHENDLLKRRLYGTKSERSQTSEMQLTLGELFDAHKALQKQLDEAVQKAADEAGDGNPKGTPGQRKAHGGGRPQLELSKLPRTVVEIPDPDLESTAKRIGFEDSYLYLRQRGGWSVLVKRTIKYEVAGPSGPTVVAAPQPKTLFRKGLLHSSVVAHLLVQKFALGVPHYRLEQHMQAETVSIDRSTMCRYAEEAGGTLGSAIVHAMWQDALAQSCIISTDATSALIQPEKGDDGLRQACKKGHFFTAVADCDHVLFAYVERHTQDAVKSLFKGYKGYLQCDASNVYDILERGPPTEHGESVSLVGCFAHCRRYFFEAAICKYPVGVEGLARIRAMYAVDDAFQKLPPAKRLQMRDAHLRPLMDDFFEWVHRAYLTVEGRNLATRALGYARNQERELRRVLEDPRLPLDNTRAERSLRKIVVGRKAWMFYGSDAHAQSAAALFTLIASCRLHRIDPEQYIDEVLRLLPYWPPERYLELAPKCWNATRAQLDPKQLEAPLAAFTVPAAA